MTYTITKIDHRAFSKRIDATRIDGVELPRREKEVQSRGWRASGLAGCLRKTAYGLLGFKKTHDTYNADYERAADQGTLLHDNVQRHMIAAGDMLYEHPTFGPAVELSLTHCCAPGRSALRGSLQFTGHIDGVTLTKSNDLAIWDLKSVSASDLQPGNRYFGEKLQKYACQVNIYAHFFATPDDRSATQSFVLVMSRDKTSDRALYHVPYQPWKAEEEIARLEAAQAAIAAGDLPPAEPGACRFCAFRGHCEANDYAD